MSIVDVEFKKNDEARADVIVIEDDSLDISLDLRGVRASDNVRVTATGAITFELSIKPCRAFYIHAVYFMFIIAADH